MKHYSGKSISALLAALMLLLFFAACGETADTPSPVSTTAAQNTDAPAAEETTAEPEIMTDVPADLNFGGKTIRVLSWETTSYNTQLIADQMNGEVLNDALYERTAKVEEMLGLKIAETRENQPTPIIQKLIAAGDDAYDIMFTVDRDALSIAQNGNILPITSLPYVDVTREYWSQSMNEDISMLNRLYFSYGDFNLSGYEGVNTLMFNKSMSGDFGLADHYDTILSGKWTLDLLGENMIKVVADLNGDGVFNDDDRYGLTSHPKQVLPCFWIASGLRSVEKDENDAPVFRMAENQKFATFWSKIFTMMYSDNVYHDSSHLPDYANNTVFMNGQALYNIVRVAFLHFYRDCDIDYGLIPYPKWDEAQEDYYSRFEGGSLMVVTDFAANKDMAGAFMEVMACESMKMVIPAYYDVVLKNKYARDERSVEMLDLIYGNRINDLGDTFWCGQIRDGVFAGKFASNKSDYESTIAKMQKSVDKALQKAIDLFSAIEG